MLQIIRVRFMNRAFKVIFICILSFFSLILIAVGVAFAVVPTPKLSEQKLSKKQNKVFFYDEQNNLLEGVFLQNYNGNVTLDELPDHLKNAFIAVEDKRFYKHNGIDYLGLLRALKSNLLSLSLKQGGSTISQQLIKNTHLSSEKTLKRKIAEFKLTKQLEKSYSKDQILQFYLNNIYFGEGAYGLQSASKTYFNKNASELTLSESACLAGLVKAPSVYNPRKSACKNRRNTVLKLMYEQEFISANEYKNAVNQPIEALFENNEGYFKLAYDEAISKCNITPYDFDELHVYTNFSQKAQDILNSTLDCTSYQQKGIIMGRGAKIKAVYFLGEDFERMPASTIKPLLCYAPAFELGLASPTSKILDNPCDFGDFSPKNYGDKYYDWVSCENALANSLNIPAVKLLQSVGVKNAKAYLEKMNINLNEEGLNLALGAYGGGVSLTSLCSAYCTFFNGGNYSNASYLNKVVKNGKVVYQDKPADIRVFREGTCDLINQCLMQTVKSGTAKALNENGFELCAKAGTNGNQNGNTDAYTICYSSEHLFAVWAGNADNSLMDNSVTGGSLARVVNAIVSEFYKDKKPKNFTLSNDITKVKLCKLAYEEECRLLLADQNAPERYTLNGYFLKGFEPKEQSTLFSCPKILNAEIYVLDSGVKIIAQKNEHVLFEIVKTDKDGTKKIADQRDSEFLENNLSPGKYKYALVPYVLSNDGQKIYGEPYTLPEIKIELFSQDWQWWEE